jgi:glycerophosphoryl diester phosphodiesterase
MSVAAKNLVNDHREFVDSNMSSATRVWGHRGCRGATNPPENSVAAFEAALYQGALGVELDVFLSSDDRIVVFHDDTLERMSDGGGEITSHALQQLKGLRLKDCAGRLTEFGIPTLDEVLNAIERFRDAHPTLASAHNLTVNIEIKNLEGKEIALPVATEVNKRLANGWKLFNFQVSSFDIDALRKMKEINPEIPRGALFHGGQEPWDITPSQLVAQLDEARDVEPRTVNITLPSITPATVRAIRTANADVVAWTCNERDPDELDREAKRAIAETLRSNRVAAIITDYPRQMLHLLAACGSNG